MRHFKLFNRVYFVAVLLIMNLASVSLSAALQVATPVKSTPSVVEPTATPVIIATSTPIACSVPTPAPIADDCRRRCSEEPNAEHEGKVELVCGGGPAGTLCHIWLPQSLCDVLNLKSGYYSGEELDNINCAFDSDDKQLNFYCCAIKHELVHACQMRASEHGLFACEERDGNSRMIACMNTVSEGICKNGKIEDCREMCHQAAISAIGRSWDNCNCNIAAAAECTNTPFNISACCNCNTECLTNPESYLGRISSTCRSALTGDPSYWSEIQKSLLELCNKVPNFDNHGCYYFVKRDKDYNYEPEKACVLKTPVAAITVVAESSTVTESVPSAY